MERLWTIIYQQHRNYFLTIKFNSDDFSKLIELSKDGSPKRKVVSDFWEVEDPTV